MTLYRIYGDDAKYLNFVVDASDCEEKLGFDHPFHLDSRPVPYAPVWKTPLLVDFHYGRQGRNKPIPDIAENGGHLFFGEAAHARLHPLIGSAGEFLPVHFTEGTGYVFNPLRTAEEVDGIDEDKTALDAHGNLVHYAFREDRVSALPIFKTEIDTFLGIFCHDAFKDAVAEGGFTGLTFGGDYSNPIGTAFGSTH